LYIGKNTRRIPKNQLLSRGRVYTSEQPQEHPKEENREWIRRSNERALVRQFEPADNATNRYLFGFDRSFILQAQPGDECLLPPDFVSLFAR
jgi:hypothetical protein